MVVAAATVVGWRFAGQSGGGLPGPHEAGAGGSGSIWIDGPLLPAVSLEATPHEMAAESQRVLDALLRDFPDSPRAHCAAAHVYSLFGRSADAVEQWERSLLLDPEFAEAYRQLGSKQLKDGNHERAAELLQRAYDLESDFPGIANQLADALMHGGRMEEARRVLLHSIDSSTSTRGVHYLLGQIAHQLGEFDEAHRELTIAIREDPGNINAHYVLVRASHRLGRREEAARWQKKFLELKAAESRAGLDTMRNREDAARVRGYLAATHSEAGRVYFYHRELEPAEAHWLAAAAWSPRDAGIRRVLATFYRDHGYRVKLAKVLQQLAGIEPQDPQHVGELGRALLDVGRAAEAEAAFMRFNELAPELPDGHAGLALLRLNLLDDPAGAIAAATTALRLQASASNYFLLGVANQAAGNLPAALEALRRATELDPQHAGYRAAYDTLRQST